MTTTEDDGVTFNVLTNDIDLENDVLTVVSVNTTGTIGLVELSVLDNKITYRPNGQFENAGINDPQFDVFTYTVADPSGATATATVLVTILGLNDPPTANPDSVTTNEDTTVDVDVVGNDTDVDDGEVFVTVLFDDTGTVGTVVGINADSSITYDPAGQFESLAVGQTATDTFSYTMSDGARTGELDVISDRDRYD